MEVHENNASVERHFGFSKIRWRISQFCFESIKEGFLIFSPEFCVQGSHVTKWKLALNPKMMQNGEYHFSLCLERLGFEPGPDSASVDLKVFFLDSKGKQCCASQYSRTFKNHDSHEIILESATFIREKCDLFDYVVGVFDVYIYLFVNFEYYDENLDGSADSVFGSLSNDLLNLYKVGTDHDVILRIKNKDIYAHKAVLCSRSSSLATIIKASPENMVVDLSRLDFESVKNTVSFIYSGNICYIAKNASILMYETALYLGLDILLDYFNPHILNVGSMINMIKHTFKWTIRDYTDISGSHILSPLFTSEHLNATLRLLVYPKGINGSDLSLFADVIEGTIPENCCFGFNLDVGSQNWYEKWLVYDKSNRHFGFENFISKEFFHSILQKSDKSSCDPINFILTIQVCNESVYSTEEYMISCKTIPRKEFYWNLSNNLLSNMENCTHDAVNIQAITTSFKASKCILSARSPVLKSMLSEIDVGSTICLSMKSSVLRTVLHYIYGGVCNLVEYEILDLYTAANTLSLLDLKEKCLSALGEYLCVESACHILSFSEDQEDKELKLIVLDFISKNKTKVFEDMNWTTLATQKPLLCTEVEEFVKSNQNEKCE